MNKHLTLLAGACLLCTTLSTSLAQPGSTPATQPATQPPTQPPTTPPTPDNPTTPPNTTSGQPATTPPAPISIPIPPPPPNPNAIPVPDLPIIQKSEIEGMIIEDMKIGDGYEVKPLGAVVCHYHGTLKEDGKEFDSSFARGEPSSFPLTGVIQGWGKGVPGMKIGGIRRLTIPTALAWGDAGYGDKVPPKADVVFIIQVVDALQVEDIKVGEGEAVTGACVAVTTYSIKDAEGKEIEKADASKPYIWIPNDFQPLQFGLEGMKPGGIRKLIIPKEMNLSSPQSGSTRPQKVPLSMEFELIAARNLGNPQQQQRRPTK